MTPQLKDTVDQITAVAQSLFNFIDKGGEVPVSDGPATRLELLGVAINLVCHVNTSVSAAQLAQGTAYTAEDREHKKKMDDWLFRTQREEGGAV